MVASATVLSVFEALTASALPLTPSAVLAYAAAALSSCAAAARMPFNPSAGHPGISVFMVEAAFTVDANTATVFASATCESWTVIAVFKASDFRYPASFRRSFTALECAASHSPDASARRPWLQYRYPPPADSRTTAHPAAIAGTIHFGFEAARAAPDGSAGGRGTGFDPFIMLPSCFRYAHDDSIMRGLFRSVSSHQSERGGAFREDGKRHPFWDGRESISCREPGRRACRWYHQ